LQDTPKFTQIVILGLKVCHLATTCTTCYVATAIAVLWIYNFVFVIS
jgi:hypothetical protein